MDSSTVVDIRGTELAVGTEVLVVGSGREVHVVDDIQYDGNDGLDEAVGQLVVVRQDGWAQEFYPFFNTGAALVCSEVAVLL